MMFPTVHMNGTSRRELIEQLCDASAAIGLAIKAVENAQPNGRDYYTQGPQATGVAIGEHVNRLDRLSAVQREIQEIAEHIDEAA